MNTQPLTDAQISLLLAKEALSNPAAAAVGPTPELRAGVSEQFEAAEEVLKGCCFSCGGYDRHYSKELVFHPGRGILIADRNGSEATPWRQAPETVRSQCLPLLHLLRKQYDELAPKHQTQVLANISQATVDIAAMEPVPAEPVAEEMAPAAPEKASAEDVEDVPEPPEVLTLDDALLRAAKTQTSGRAAAKKTARGSAKAGRR